MVVDTDHHIAMSGEELHVPSKMPAVGVSCMRTAMDRMQQRPFLFRVKIGRIYHPRLDGVALPSLDRELAARANRGTGKERLVRRIQRLLTRAIRADSE